ncbi:hypothetical protein BJV82DRAFT_575760 [Fennellomyces sp. T-0311]|nr:hypothetical protein BJV82DRAFT_575760 [Fennellomyces sp. T-0311]
MVATTQHRRQSSGGGSVSGRSRRRPSLRRPSENKITNRNVNKPAPRRASGSLLQPTPTHDWRRPSAPANIEVPRLSIADRFMQSNYSGPPSPATIDDHEAANTPSPPPPASMRLSTDPNPSRLTIADTFLKNNSSRSLLTVDSNTNSRPSTITVPDPAPHPLEAPARSTLDTHIHLDLDLTLPSPASTFDGRRYSRPFGSQDTLVQMPPEKKMDFEKESIADYETCSLRSTPSTENEKQPQQDTKWRNLPEEEAQEGSKPRGMWIGCCFFSCGSQRPRQKHMEETRPRKCGRRAWVFGSFIFFILLITAAYLLWPRTPLMRIEGATLLAPARITETHQGVMVGNVAFESQWNVNVTVDNRQNRVPTRLTRIEVLAKDALTGLVIGKGLHNDNNNDEGAETTLPANMISTIQLPIYLDYQARDDTDTTFATLKKACTQQPPKTYHDSKTNQTITEQPKRESLQLHFWITLHIFGLDWLGYRPTVIAAPATGGFACPLS